MRIFIQNNTNNISCKEVRLDEVNGDKNEEQISFISEVCDTDNKRSVRKRAAKSAKRSELPESAKSKNGEGSDGASLRLAANRIAALLCELSADKTLFVSENGASPTRRLDTKALKEFSGVLKEMSAVITELNADTQDTDKASVRIEFSDEAAELGS